MPYSIAIPSDKLYLIILLPILFLVSACADQVTDPGQSDDNDDSNDETDHSANLLSVGDSAKDLLSDENFDHLLVQVQYMEGAEPTDEALDNLGAFLEERVRKNNIEFQIDEPIPDGGKEKYSYKEIRDLEDEHRTEYNQGKTIAVYYLYVNGGSDQDSEDSFTLGAAYHNTSLVMFQDNIEKVSGGLGRPSKKNVETTVLNHEFSHIFSLVGIDYDADQKDDDHGNHCSNDQCLMYYTATTNDISGLITGGSVPELDENCLADLVAMGGK